MRGQNIQLSFKCPKSWDSLQVADGGRFCSDCRKLVKDISKTPMGKLNEAIGCSEVELCGSFRAYQLHRPFGNWRDTLISFYQKTLLDASSRKLSKRFSAFLLIIVLIATGCHRRTMGAIALHNGVNPRDLKGPAVTQTSLPPLGKGY